MPAFIFTAVSACLMIFFCENHKTILHVKIFVLFQHLFNDFTGNRPAKYSFNEFPLP